MRAHEQPVDFLVYDRSGQLVAAVEAKRRLGTSTQWAAELRAGVFEQMPLQDIPFFVLVVPEAIYIWTSTAPAVAPPTFELDARVVLAPYYERIGVDAAQIHPMAFETLVWWWLRDLTLGSEQTPDPHLEASGFVSALAGGRLAQQDAA